MSVLTEDGFQEPATSVALFTTAVPSERRLPKAIKAAAGDGRSLTRPDLLFFAFFPDPEST